MKTETRLLTPREAADEVGVELGTFAQWIARGKVRVERYLVNKTKRARVTPEELNRVKSLLVRNLPLPVVAE